mgnify:FL=1
METNPSYTAGESIVHPLAIIHLILSVDFVKGKINVIILRTLCIPSMGQTIPHNITRGKKLPIAIYVADLSFSQLHATTNPKHIPQSPVKIIRIETQNKLPFWVIPKIEKVQTKTMAACPNMTANWVKTCENSSSMPLIPFTRERSRMPSFRSRSMAPEVRATARKNIILEEEGW